MKLDNVIQPGRATYMPTANMPTGLGGTGGGFSVDADNEAYNALFDKVIADERHRRVEQGLPPDEPGFWARVKAKFFTRKGSNPTYLKGYEEMH